MKKRITAAFINRYFYPVTAGIEEALFESLTRLAKTDWDITVYTSKNTLTTKNTLPNKAIIAGVHIKRYHYGLFGFMPDIPWKDLDIVCLENFDIFPHFFILLSILVLKIQNKKKFRLILTPHGGYTPIWTIFSIPARIVKYTYHRTIGWVFLNYVIDGIHAVSEWEKEALIKYYVNPQKIKVILNGIDDKAFTEKIDQFVDLKTKNISKTYQKYIIQVGRIHPVKNYETTIKALAIAKTKLHFLIIGPIQDTAYATYLVSLVKKLHLENVVSFVGVVRGYDKFYLLRHAVCMVHMARWENAPISVMEGMSQGLPCITSNRAGLQSFIHPENGFQLPAENVTLLSRTIQEISHGNYQKMHIVNRQAAKAFSWEQIVQEMKRYYQMS